MVRRRPLAVIGALCAVIALQGAPAATAQVPEPGPRVVITDLPALSQLPPLPAGGEDAAEEKAPDEGTFGMSAVQMVALVLAVGALVAGGTGLALVTRRGRGTPPEEAPRRAPTPPTVAR